MNTTNNTDRRYRFAITIGKDEIGFFTTVNDHGKPVRVFRNKSVPTQEIDARAYAAGAVAALGLAGYDDRALDY